MESGKKSLMETSERDNYADFLKYVLISLVVLGHFINGYQYTTGFTGGMYTWIYTFHMPLFVFISGYFSKHINNLRKKNIDTILFPFFVFQILNVVYTAIIPIEPLSKNIFYPYHQNWYLIALFWWRSFIPYRKFFKKWVVLTLCVFVSLFVGFFSGWDGFLGLYKTAYLLPFFVLGTYCEDLQRLLGKLLKNKAIWMGVFVLSLVIVFLLSYDKEILLKMNYAFKANDGYSGEWQNLFLRTIALLTSLLMIASVLLMTKLLYDSFKRIRLIGSGGTMLAFLGHEFIMIPLLPVYGKLGVFGFVLCVISSFVVTFILTRKQIVDFFSPVMDMSVLCKKLKINLYCDIEK